MRSKFTNTNDFDKGQHLPFEDEKFSLVQHKLFVSRKLLKHSHQVTQAAVPVTQETVKRRYQNFSKFFLVFQFSRFFFRFFGISANFKIWKISEKIYVEHVPSITISSLWSYPYPQDWGQWFYGIHHIWLQCHEGHVAGGFSL